MREIKFRAWDKQENIMHDVECVYMEPSGSGKDITVKSKDEEGVLEWLSFDDAELMQFTGLRDKNGTEIYEGDIVEAMSEGLKGIFEIRWRQDGSPCWILYPAWQGNEMWHIASQKHSDGNYYDKLEVIGSIYENPELLGDNQ